MDGKIEQGVCIKFCLKLSKSATETLEMLRESFGEHSLSRTAVSEWHSRFNAGRVSVEDDERSGRRSTSKTTEDVEKIRELIHEDRRRTIHELADTVWISYGVCLEILTENLNMRRTAPRLLTNDEKQQRVNMCLELRENANEDRTSTSRMITGDESWIYGYGPETSQPSLQWKSPQSP
jgi:DNA-binding transcriptional ArsR family regulator